MAWIEPRKRRVMADIIRRLHRGLTVEAEIREQVAAPGMSEGSSMPAGTLALGELTAMLDALPVDITFVDADDRVKYFSQGSEQTCHPPQSLKKVMEILESFRDGSRDHADFWIQLGDQFVCIQCFAVLDPHGHCLGTLEVTQDLTDIRGLSSEKRRLSDAEWRRRASRLRVGLVPRTVAGAPRRIAGGGFSCIAGGGFYLSRGTAQAENPENKPSKGNQEWNSNNQNLCSEYAHASKGKARESRGFPLISSSARSSA